MKKFNFAAFILCLLLVATVTLGVIYREDLQLMFSGQKLYTASQYADAYKAGQESEYKDREQNQETIDNLRLELGAQERLLVGKDAIIQSKDQELEQMDEQLTEKDEEITRLEDEISFMQIEMSDLDALIASYDAFVSSNLNSNQAIVKFFLNNKLCGFKVVSKGTALTSADIPQITLPDGFRFHGWVLESGNLTNYWGNEIEVDGDTISPVGCHVNSSANFNANVTQDVHYKVIVNNTKHNIRIEEELILSGDYWYANTLNSNYGNNIIIDSGNLNNNNPYAHSNGDYLLDYTYVSGNSGNINPNYSIQIHLEYEINNQEWWCDDVFELNNNGEYVKYVWPAGDKPVNYSDYTISLIKL